MPAGKKRVGLAVIVAIATAMNTFIAVPAFPQSSPLRNSPSSTYTPSDNQGDNNSNISALDVARPILIGGVAALALTTLGLATALLSGRNKEQVEELLKSTRETVNAVKRSQLAFNFSASRPQNITDEAHSSLSSIAAELIESYHTQALTQAAAQFWFSVSAATIGFLFIMYIGFFYSLKRQPQLTLLNTLPGIAIEAVAALFFKQAEDTRKRATELYDRLRLDDKQTQAITLIESIENQDLRDFVKAQWALQIVGLESQPLPNHLIYQKDEENKTSLTEKENPNTRQFIR
ncbi:TRADD-N-associated membrane domain-containing protein [Scytonema sp. PRP1]|uniref:TRADD-N-associated membrane domain-containing protein n=1 Tax=Scytonema sp. PRP1 TaxID=3120513 RepID=UPI00300C5C31